MFSLCHSRGILIGNLSLYLLDLRFRHYGGDGTLYHHRGDGTLYHHRGDDIIVLSQPRHSRGVLIGRGMDATY